MSWISGLNKTSSTRSDNPRFTSEAREEHRKKLESERLEKAKKRAAQKALFKAGVSAPSSPSTSRVPSPVREHLEANNFPLDNLPEIEDDRLSLPDIFDIAVDILDFEIKLSELYRVFTCPS